MNRIAGIAGAMRLAMSRYRGDFDATAASWHDASTQRYRVAYYKPICDLLSIYEGDLSQLASEVETIQKGLPRV